MYDSSAQKEALDNLAQDIVAAHNEKRALHKDTPPVEWCDKLAADAQVWADKIAADGAMSHCAKQDREGQGENIATCKGLKMNL